MKVSMRAFNGFCLVLALAVFAGCGSKKPEFKAEGGGPGGKPPTDLVKVGGTVTIDGKAIPNVVVVFSKADLAQKAIEQSQPIPPYGKTITTDKDGKWAYSTYGQADGVEPGKYFVVFRWLPALRKRADREDALIAMDVSDTLPEVITRSKEFEPKMGTFYAKYRGGGPGMMKIDVEAGKPQTDLKWDLTSE